MKRDDNKVLKRILFLFIFVFVTASIVLLRPNTLSKLQGNASSYNVNTSIDEKTGVVITTDYLIENLASNDLKLYIYNGAERGINITKIISKRMGEDKYIEYPYNSYVNAKDNGIITFGQTQLNCGDDKSVCTGNKSISLGNGETIQYQNFIIGIEYELNGNAYYLVSTVLYLDTSKLSNNNIQLIRNIDNTKSATAFIHNLSIDENNKLITSPFVGNEYDFHELEKTNNSGEYKIDLNEKISGEIAYNYETSSQNKLANITYGYNYNKYLFVDINEKPTDNLDFNFDVYYKFNNYDELNNQDSFKYYNKFIITDHESLESDKELFNVSNKYDYVPSSDIINIPFSKYKSQSYYSLYSYTSKISSETKNNTLFIDSSKFNSSRLLLEKRIVNQFYVDNTNNNYINGIYTPIYVTKYDKSDLEKAIVNGINKLRSASEDSIDVNSYLTYTNLLTTAIDLYSSRYTYEINGNKYLVNSANIYQLTKILNEYTFKEQKKADYTEIDKTIEIAEDALNKYKRNPIIIGEKNVNNTLKDLINNFNDNYRNLSINYEGFINEYKLKIEAEIKNFPVYTNDYMNLYNAKTTEKENPRVPIILVDSKRLEEYFQERIQYAIKKVNEDEYELTSYELMKQYIFDTNTYDLFYVDGPEENLYSDQVWKNYYDVLSKYYGTGSSPQFDNMNFFEHQSSINNATSELQDALNTLHDNVKMVDKVWINKLYDDSENSTVFDELIDSLNNGISELYAALSNDTYSEVLKLANTLNTKLPLNGKTEYNGKLVNNQVFFNNTAMDISFRILYDIVFNRDIDGLKKDGRNSRENLGYLSLEEYYDFYYSLDIDDYDIEDLNKIWKSEEFEGITDIIETNSDKQFVKSFDEWYVQLVYADLESSYYFLQMQTMVYELQNSFKYIKNNLTPKVGDYTEICNYYKVLTSLNLDYYYPETKDDIVNKLWEINWSYRKNEQDKIDAQAKMLKTFIDSLSMRKADTSKLYEAYNKALKYDKNLYSNYYELESAISGFNSLNNVYVDRQKEVDALTNKINKSIDGLSLKRADYVKIEYLKAKIDNLDPERYENFNLVDNALNDIVYGLDITKQAEVDKMYNNLFNAFVSLKRNGNDPADYSEYKELVSTVPTFIKGYDKETQEKINALKKEIEEFSMDLKLKDQSKIDNMVSKIKKTLSELSLNYSNNLETVIPTDTKLIKSIKINNNAIDISRMPFDYSVGYSDTSVDIEVEVVKDAKVFVYGGSSLFYGENIINIEVIYLNKLYNYELNVYRKSSSNYLKDLKIHTKGASFNSENFNKEKQDYIVKINNDVTRLDIEAIPEEETAKINIKNNHKLKDDSRVQIEVTSKDGSFRVYTLIIKKTSVVNYKVLIVLAVIFILLAFALKGLQNLSKKKAENE